jgi:hypothetical protein
MKLKMTLKSMEKYKKDMENELINFFKKHSAKQRITNKAIEILNDYLNI